MTTGTKELEGSTNARRVIASEATGLYDFYKIKYIRTVIVQGVSNTIPNTSPREDAVIAANDGLDENIENYVKDNFPFDVDYMNTTSYLCYEVSRGVMSAADAGVTYLHAQVDIYEIARSTEDNMYPR
jgi:hypothetical protein